MAVDTSGNIYVTDLGNLRIEKFDPESQFVGEFGLAPPSGSVYWMDVAVDGSGNVYAVDEDNRRVGKFDSDGNFLLQFEPFCTQGGSCIDPDGPGPRPTVYAPSGVAVDGAGFVYVTGAQKYLQKFDPVTGALVNDFGISAVLPRCIAIRDSGMIFVYDTIALHNSLPTDQVQPFLQFGNYDRSNVPTALATDTEDNTIAGDLGASRILKYSAAGQLLWSYGTQSSRRPASRGACRFLTGSSTGLWPVSFRGRRSQ